MKKFKAIKSLDSSTLPKEQKLTREQMYQTTGGGPLYLDRSSGTLSQCLADGTIEETDEQS